MKDLQKKLLRSALKKIAADRFSSLSGIELPIYFNHRLKKILAPKKILVKNELEYLLTETGPGNLRFTPELVQLLTKENIFISKAFQNSSEKQILLKQKLEVEEYILKHRNSPETQKLIIKTLSNYLKSVEISSSSPLIVHGVFNDIPVSCLIKNGEWILPNTELFSFLKNCQTQKIFPLLIAKKIAGILFPVFKSLSVLGLNTYKIYLPEEIRQLLGNIKNNENEFDGIKYCNQFIVMGINSPHHILNSPQEEPLRQFFEIILTTHISDYQNNFLQSKILIKDNFLNTVSQFK